VSHTSSPFCSGYFGEGVSWTICLGWCQTYILLLSAPSVARIAVMNHQHPALKHLIRWKESQLIELLKPAMYATQNLHSIVSLGFWTQDLVHAKENVLQLSYTPSLKIQFLNRSWMQRLCSLNTRIYYWEKPIIGACEAPYWFEHTQKDVHIHRTESPYKQWISGSCHAHHH
jgi:hypothetical protein